MPPEAVTVTVVEPPKHAIAPAEEEAVTAEGSVIVILVEAVQPLASVTMKV